MNKWWNQSINQSSNESIIEWINRIESNQSIEWINQSCCSKQRAIEYFLNHALPAIPMAEWIESDTPPAKWTFKPYLIIAAYVPCLSESPNKLDGRIPFSRQQRPNTIQWPPSRPRQNHQKRHGVRRRVSLKLAPYIHQRPSHLTDPNLPYRDEPSSSSHATPRHSRPITSQPKVSSPARSNKNIQNVLICDFIGWKKHRVTPKTIFRPLTGNQARLISQTILPNIIRRLAHHRQVRLICFFVPNKRPKTIVCKGVLKY